MAAKATDIKLGAPLWGFFYALRTSFLHLADRFLLPKRLILQKQAPKPRLEWLQSAFEGLLKRCCNPVHINNTCFWRHFYPF